MNLREFVKLFSNPTVPTILLSDIWFKFKLKDSEELRDKDNLVKSFVFIRDYKSKKD